MRTPALIAITAIVALAAGAGAVLAVRLFTSDAPDQTLSHDHHVGRITQIQTSTNWAGYVIDPKNDRTKFEVQSGSWVVPAGRCVPGRVTYSATWIGIGGYEPESRALEQIGTEFDCDETGQASYTAWYELVPDAGHDIAMTVHPGDRIDATVHVEGHKIRLMLSNRTTNENFDQSFYMAAPDPFTAEWIVEAPTVCDNTGQHCVQPIVSDFGKVPFAKARVQISDRKAGGRERGYVATISNPRWVTSKLHLAPRAGMPGAPTDLDGARTSRLSDHGEEFYVSFQDR